MKWLKRISIALALLLVVAVAVPFFVSLDDYIPRIEKEASARLKEPVTIKSIKVGMLPVPHVTVDGIAVGKTEDLKVGKVSVTPDLFSLLAETKVIKSIELKSLVLTQKAIDKIPVWSKSDGARPAGQPPLVRVESIRLDDALVKLDKASFGPFEARINLDSKGEPVDAMITTQDGKLKVTVKPDKTNYLIDATAKAWKLPVGPAIEFDELFIKGVATLNSADFSQISAKLYGGTVSGRATAAWQKGLQVKGNVDINQVELKSLVPLVSPGTNMSGRFNAKPVFSAASADAGQLMNTLHLETPFNVQNGVLHGVDIQKAATSLIKQGESGGETRFEQLSGHLVRDRGAHQFTQLKISSGSLAADGNVNISVKQDLSGRVNAQIKAMGTSAGVPLNVAGTIHSPLLYPTGGTMAGAAIGTVLLPGVGTGLGAKAGQAIENLFGGKNDKQPKK
jgi:uncharacterized protein involved in outer membrane biogenesis